MNIIMLANPQDQKYCGECKLFCQTYSNFGDICGTCRAFPGYVLSNEIIHFNNNKYQWTSPLRCKPCIEQEANNE